MNAWFALPAAFVLGILWNVLFLNWHNTMWHWPVSTVDYNFALVVVSLLGNASLLKFYFKVGFNLTITQIKQQSIICNDTYLLNCYKCKMEHDVESAKGRWIHIQDWEPVTKFTMNFAWPWMRHFTLQDLTFHIIKMSSIESSQDLYRPKMSWHSVITSIAL